METNLPENEGVKGKLEAEKQGEGQIEKMPDPAGGNGDKKQGKETSSTRWGQEWLSTKDFGQHPEKTRTPGERELSEFDDNTTTVGQAGDRQNLGGATRWDAEASSGGRQEEVNPKSNKK